MDAKCHCSRVVSHYCRDCSHVTCCAHSYEHLQVYCEDCGTSACIRKCCDHRTSLNPISAVSAVNFVTNFQKKWSGTPTHLDHKCHCGARVCACCTDCDIHTCLNHIKSHFQTHCAKCNKSHCDVKGCPLQVPTNTPDRKCHCGARARVSCVDCDVFACYNHFNGHPQRYCANCGTSRCSRQRCPHWEPVDTADTIIGPCVRGGATDDLDAVIADALVEEKRLYIHRLETLVEKYGIKDMPSDISRPLFEEVMRACETSDFDSNTLYYCARQVYQRYCDITRHNIETDYALSYSRSPSLRDLDGLHPRSKEKRDVWNSTSHAGSVSQRRMVRDEGRKLFRETTEKLVAKHKIHEMSPEIAAGFFNEVARAHSRDVFDVNALIEAAEEVSRKQWFKTGDHLATFDARGPRD